MSEIVAEFAEVAAPVVTRAEAVLKRASRAAAWGTLAAVGSVLAAPILGVSAGLFVVGGLGAIVGGLGAAVAAAGVLQNKAARLQWRIAGAVGLPFGASLVVYGFSWFLWRPLSVAAAFDPPLLLKLALFALIFLGPVLAIFVGLDVARFLVRGILGMGAGDRDGDNVS